MRRRRHPKNRRPWKGGFQTYVEVHGRPRYKSWPATASDQEMEEWVTDQKKDRRTVTGPTRGTFAADVTIYLSRIAAIPSYKQFAAYLEEWMRALGRDRPRRTITATEIDATMQRWEMAGIGVTTLRKRRMVLMSLWNRLDGKDAPNPLRAARNPPAPKPEARALSYPVITKILAQMPERTEKQRACKRRVTVIAYTGIPPKQLGKITPADLNLRAKTVRLAPRTKGKGVEARTMPLIPAGVTAFRAFHVGNTYGPFREDITNREFRWAAARAGIHGVTVYDLRHSFATALYLAVRDLDTVARFLQHSTTALTQRYAKAATDHVDRAAAQALGRNMSLQPVPKLKQARNH